MKLDRDLLNECYRDAMILQYKKELEGQGFAVSPEHQFFGTQVDLYAEKGSEKTVYNFKLVGNNLYNRGNIKKFKETVEAHDAVPYIIYVNPPVERQIQFDHLGELLTNYFTTAELPSELDELSTHTAVDIVEIDDLTSIELDAAAIKIDGYATISVDMQYGSDSDMECGDGMSCSDSFPMSFSLTMNYDEDYSISDEDIEYDIDTSSFYE